MMPLNVRIVNKTVLTALWGQSQSPAPDFIDYLYNTEYLAIKP